jgi:hypothetical protein
MKRNLQTLILTPAAIKERISRSRLLQSTVIDIISPSLERQIIEGKDVNLASLLIPNYECPQTHTITTNSLEVNVPAFSAGVVNLLRCVLFDNWLTVSCNPE